MSQLFTPVGIGRYTARNRLVMSPMTRSRCDDTTGEAKDLVREYYEQRAGAGLIITEGTGPSAMGKGYVRMPGMYTGAQAASWRPVTDAVHAKGGLIFMQVMHCGRISHPSMLPGGVQPVAPSAIKPKGQSYTSTGPQDYVQPRALATEEIAGVVAEFGTATRLALEAGFDGVELHCASGYLPEQFLSSKTNQRDDRYGGSLENRARFVIDALRAMTDAAGPDRVGIKIAPEMNFNDVEDATPRETYMHLVQAIAPLGLAYLDVHLYGPTTGYHEMFRPAFPGAYLHGSGLTQAKAEALVAGREADAGVFGVLFLANPDLPERFQQGAPLNTPDKTTFYTDGPKGYTDYPFLAERPA